TVPDRFKHITFVKQEQDTITVKLPPKVMIEDSEAALNQPGATYPLPPFYKRLFNGMDPVIPEREKFKVHAERIGDYTISACAGHPAAALSPGQWRNAFDRNPGAVQAAAQGFP